MKFAKKFLALSLILSISFGSTAFGASKYSDVAENHWAYSSIIAMAEKGYMVGNISGEYNPNSPIDKFDTSKIFALAAGYKYTGLTTGESEAYARAYNTYKPLLDGYKKSYTKWTSNADKEIAYLLDKGIYEANDLELFILKNGDKENLRALSRQEAAVYLTKLMGRKNEALNYNYTASFADDAKIGSTYKPYVYYLKSLGIISGEANNNFNPNGAVTRASMAVMLDKSLALGVNTSSAGSSYTPSGSNSADSQAALIDTISGKIEKVHSTLNALQIKYDSGETKIHKVEASSTIFIDGNIKTLYDLQENMPVIGIVKNNAIVNIKAQSVKNQTSAPVTGSTTPTPSTTVQNNNVEYRTLQGTVTAVKSSLADNQTVTIEVRIINPSGGIIVERETFKVESDCRITRGGKDITFAQAAVNDVVKAKVAGGKAYVLELEEKNRRMSVTVVDKKTETTLGTNYYIVEDSQGEVHELVVNNETALTRKGFGAVKFNDVRIGDTLDLTAEYSVIKEAYAYGTQGYIEGIVSEIHITKNGTYLMLSDSNGKATKYHVIDGAFNVYDLRLNSKIRLRLDSKEIEGISVLEDAATNYYTGYVDSINSRYIVLRSGTAANSPTTKVYYNTYTLVTDSTTGQKSSLNNLYSGMKVYVVFDDYSSDTAESITILSK